MIFLNATYKNIFAFDFKPLHPTPVVKSISTLNNQFNYKEAFDQMTKELKNQLWDSLKTITFTPIDSTKNKIDGSVLTDSIKSLKAMIENIAKADSIAKLQPIVSEKAKNDTTYLKWTKKTAALYEAMDSKKAAKIIQNYSDNIARDILYTMKKKKAADVLANLNPETANRITRIQ
jgi:flagellar motility protein MotE (MotC chaperone)